MSAPRDSSALKSAPKVLDVLSLLAPNFVHGLTLTEIAKATNNSMPTTSRYVDALESKGYVERIPETGRIRPSITYAQHAIAILENIERTQNRMTEVKNRLQTKR